MSVYAIALNEHPLIVGADDERTDEELIEAVEERTEADIDIEWSVCVSDPGGDFERLRYVTPAHRFYVRSNEESDDVFDAVADAIDVEGFDIESAAMSHYGEVEDYDEIHIDLM